MGYVKPAVPLWHFQAREPMTQNDRVKITYDNGASIYVYKSGEHWLVDDGLLTGDLLEIRSKYHVVGFQVVRHTASGLESGSIGSPLVLMAHGSSEYAGKSLRCISIPVVMAIVPAIKPLAISSKALSFVVADEPPALH